MGDLRLIIEPDPDEAEAAEIFVDGRIGARPYRFLLDTGAAKTSVIFDDATASYSASGKNESSGLFARISRDLITVPRIEVGPISKQDFTIVRLAEGEPNIRSGIGMDLLKDFRCHFFFDEQRVSVDTDADSESDAGYVHQELFLGEKFHPFVDVQIGPRLAKAVWDTGAGMTIVDMSLIEELPALFEEVGQSSGTDSTGAQLETPIFVMAGATIGGSVFPPHRVAGVDLSFVNASIDVPMDLILGYSTLSKARWRFDFPRRKWAITRCFTSS